MNRICPLREFFYLYNLFIFSIYTIYFYFFL
nr:MAG TPA: Protein of unknown function (DUF3270) [Caudoviricetes sp.]DAQ62859.1 MAG TPA: Protein of unknown function (DUF3270) [Caudoviricetes sp.]